MTVTKIIGVGNPYRRDDSVGLLAARRLRRSIGAAVFVEEASGEGIDLIDRWLHCDSVILIDAVRSGAEPGTIHCMDAYHESIPRSFFSYSTHAFSVAEAVEMARVLGRLPSTLTIYGIEGFDFSPGEGLTPVVETAMEEVVRDVERLASSVECRVSSV